MQKNNLDTKKNKIWIFKLHLKISSNAHSTAETRTTIVQDFRCISFQNDSACPHKVIAPNAVRYR